jgi:hypothetical protein
VLGIVVGAVVAGGVAYASSQNPVDGNGVIHGCYNRSSGAFQLQVGTQCPASGPKTPITWNAKGQPGSVVIARVRLSTPPFTPPLYDPNAAPSDWPVVPLSPSQWAQAPGDLLLLRGWVTYTSPTTCHLPDGSPYDTPILAAQLNIDGQPPSGGPGQGLQEVDGTLGHTKTDVLAFGDFEPEVSSPASHQITVRMASRSCAGAGETFSVLDYGVDVIRVR